LVGSGVGYCVGEVVRGLPEGAGTGFPFVTPMLIPIMIKDNNCIEGCGIVHSISPQSLGLREGGET